MGGTTSVDPSSNMTPLMRAARKGNADAVKCLIDLGANEALPDVGGSLALHHAAESGNVDCVNILVGNSAHVSHTMDDGCTPLHIASRRGHVECMQVLLQNGAPVDAVAGPHHDTALMMAAENGLVDACKVLVASGADPKKTDGDGACALHRVPTCAPTHPSA